MSSDPVVGLVDDSHVQDPAKKIFEKMKAKSGSVPKWMRVMANCGDIFTGFFSLFQATMDNSPLDAKLKWRIAYVISEENKCEYCTSVSEMQLKSFGMDISVDKNLLTSDMSERESLAMEFAKQCNSHAYKIDPELMEKVTQKFSDEELVELTSVVGLFNFINRFNDALGVLPD